MPDIGITVTPPLENVGKAISLIKLGAALQRGVEKFAFNIERESKKETPVDTGRLRSSIFTDIGTLRAKIAPNVIYAGWIHDGKMTRGGRTIFLKGRGRAGTPPGGKPFMALGEEKARAKGEKEIISQLTTEINRNVVRI